MKNTFVISKKIEDITKKLDSRRFKMSEDNKNEFVEEALENDFVSPPEEEVEELDLDEIPEFEDLPDMATAAEEAEKYGVIDDDKKSKTAVRLAFVGAGQGGSNLVDQFYKLGYRRVLAINTTHQDMKSLIVPKEQQLVFSGYMGAGKDPRVGKKAAEENFEEIMSSFHRCLGKNVDHIIICCGGGGGTGSGSAETLVNIAEEYFKKHDQEPNIGLVMTTPDKTEKGVVKQNSDILLKKLSHKMNDKKLSPLVVVDNAQISKFFPNESISNFYPKSNKIVCGILDRFNTITAYASPIGYNVDVADFKTVLTGGVTTYGQCKIRDLKDNTSLAEGIVKNVKNTLLSQKFDLSKASHAACLIVAGKDDIDTITKDAVDKALEALSRVFNNSEVKIHLGIYRAPSKGISVYTMVSGLGTREQGNKK